MNKPLPKNTVTMALPIIGSMLVMVITFMGWFFLNSLDTFYEADVKINFERELREKLSMLRERMEPRALAFESLLSAIRGVSKIDANSAALISKRVFGSFNGKASFALYSNSGKILAKSGFDSSVISDLEIILRELSFKTENGSHREFSKYYASSVSLFGRDVFWNGDNPNLISFVEEKLRNKEHGFFLMGVLIPQSFQKRADLLPSAKSYPFYKSGNFKCQGTFAVFVPSKILRESNEIENILKSLKDNVSMPLWSGTLQDMQRTNEIPDSLKSAIHEQFQTGHLQGVCVKNSWGACFFSLPHSTDRILIYVKKIDPFFRLGQSPLVIATALFFVLSMIIGFRMQSGCYETWNSSLLGKFMVLCAASFFITTIAACGVVFSRNYWEAKNARVAAFNQMEAQLKGLEESHDKFIGDVVSKIKRFLVPSRWRGKFPTTQEVEKLTEELHHYGVSAVFAFHASKGKLWVLPTDPGINPTIRKTRELITGLLTAIQESLKFGNAKLKDMVKGQLIVDILTAFLGKEALYCLALKQNEISSFSLFGEQTWTYFHILHGFDKKPFLFFFFNLGRRGIQVREVTKWINQSNKHSDALPSLVLMRKELIPMFLMPEWATKQPLLYPVLAPLAREGGVQKLSLNISGKPMICLARPLQDTDFVALALRPDPLASAHQVFGKEKWYFLLAMLYPFIVVAIGAVLFNTFFLRPVLALKEGVDNIASGNFEIQLPVLTNDEIGALCQSFNNMTVGLKEKEYLERFLSDLTKEVVRSKGQTQATRVRASILFSDIREFTALSETHSAEEMVEMLNNYLTCMEEVIESNGGAIDKFIGDAIMAIFLPTHGMKPPALRAAETGLAMMKALDEFNRQRAIQKKFTIRTGVGVSSGEVLMGTLGRSEGRQDFTIVGTTVNQASYMEKLTKRAQKSFVVVCPNSASFLQSIMKLQPIFKENNSIVAYEVESIG